MFEFGAALLFITPVPDYSFKVVYTNPVPQHSPIFSAVRITYTPILLGGLMKTCDNRAPIEIRNKGTWINVERLRWARQFNIPMSQSFPTGFPKPTLHLQRFLTALDMTRPDLLTTALDALFAALWTEPNEANLPDPKVFAPLLAKVLGEDIVGRCVESMGTAEVKKQLLKNTDQAFGDGAFGLPWFQCQNAEGEIEGFWGFDHLGQVVRFMGLDGDKAVRALL